MEVTLERVQMKFACIIGELCSEPLLLSQFAIWLDLRLAEYKTKGALSLECTGESPDPIWMKGFLPPRFSEREENPESVSPTSLVQSQTNRPTDSSSTTDRSSPDVVVKEEPVESVDNIVGTCIFPVELIQHNGALADRTYTKKRISSENIPSDKSLQSKIAYNLLQQGRQSSDASSPKVRRVTSPSQNLVPDPTLEPVSESLMSIINRDLEEQNSENPDSDNNNALRGEQCGGDNSESFLSCLGHLKSDGIANQPGETAKQDNADVSVSTDDPDYWKSCEPESKTSLLDSITLKVKSSKGTFLTESSLFEANSEAISPGEDDERVFSSEFPPDERLQDLRATYKSHWSPQDMTMAIKAVLVDKMTISAAGRKFRIPKTTLFGRIKASRKKDVEEH